MYPNILGPTAQKITSPWQYKERIRIVHQHADEESPPPPARLQQHTGAQLVPSTVRRRPAAEGLPAHPSGALHLSESTLTCFYKAQPFEEAVEYTVLGPDRGLHGPSKRSCPPLHWGENLQTKVLTHMHRQCLGLPRATSLRRHPCLQEEPDRDDLSQRIRSTPAASRDSRGLPALDLPGRQRLQEPKFDSQEWLAQETVTCLHRPPNSSVTNPIENDFPPRKDNVAAWKP
jgi:hypothetical protein